MIKQTVFFGVLLCVLALVFIWSAIHPYDYFTWFLEVLPAIIALPILYFTYQKFPLTKLSVRFNSNSRDYLDGWRALYLCASAYQ
jgi:uncharacterized membrane protein YjdF